MTRDDIPSYVVMIGSTAYRNGWHNPHASKTTTRNWVTRLLGMLTNTRLA